MRKLVWLLVVLALVAGGVVLVHLRRQAVVRAPLPQPRPYAVRVARPQPRRVVETRAFLARLESARRVVISSKLSGRIRQVLVRESQAVAQGQVLLRIDDQEVRAGLAAARSALAAARRKRDYNRRLYQRNLALFKSGGISREKLEASRVAFAEAVAGVIELEQKIRSLQVQLSYLELRAPFAGVVGKVMVRAGDLATPGRPLVSLNSHEQKLTFRYAPSRREIAPGQEVLWRGRSLGRIRTIYPDASQGLAVAEVRPREPLDLPSGSYLTVRVVVRRGRGCAVPVEALLHTPGGVQVMQQAEGGFRPLRVQVRVQGRDYALVEPCPPAPVAVAAEAKLSLLPLYGARVVGEVR
jgi:RND family efflux transporter MFP subunit